jgi:GTPase SAR1 family protein
MSYLRGAAGYLLVVDGTRLATLDVALGLEETVRAEVGDIPFVICLNKADRRSEWEIDLDLLDARARVGAWSVIKTSAKLGIGVDEAFLQLTRRMLAARATRA